MQKKVYFLFSIISLSLAFSVGYQYFYNHNIKKHQPSLREENISAYKEEEDIIQIENLVKENSDVVGYLKIEDTNIDYPVMYTKDEDFYIDKDFYKEYSKAGSLYIDKHNSINPRDTNIIIHGHSMKDGSMFHDLLKYKDKSFYDSHQKIIYYTLEGKEEYQIVDVIISEVYSIDADVFKYYKFYNSKSEEDYDSFLTNIQNLSLYSTNKVESAFDELLTLSTCEYSKEDSRLAVIARRVK